MLAFIAHQEAPCQVELSALQDLSALVAHLILELAMQQVVSTVPLVLLLILLHRMDISLVLSA
jgi:hypothetical protein